MDRKSFTFLCHANNLNFSDVAKIAGVSRQLVSQWMNSKVNFINIKSSTLKKLSEGLNVSADVLLNPLPGLATLETQKTKLLWDRLFPNLGAFYTALLHGDEKSLARLVEVYGLFEAEKILGKKVWRMFDIYSFRIPPARRKNLAALVEEDLSIHT